MKPSDAALDRPEVIGRNRPGHRFVSRRYQLTKDSSVPWIGRIPQHWDCLHLARVTISRCDGPFGSGLKSEHYTEAGARVIRLQNIGTATFRAHDTAYVAAEYFRKKLNRHDVQAGDLLVAGLGDENHPVGRACVAPQNLGLALVKADCFRFRLDRERADPHFVAYQLSALAPEVGKFYSTGSTRARVNLGLMSFRRIALPKLTEQRAIVGFLNRETARIDALVAKKERLIDLLEEKRSALISRAVTQGLDPTVPRLESSSQFVPARPAHWRETKLGYLCRLVSGSTPSKDNPDYWNGDLPWVSPKDMKVFEIRDSEDHVTESAVRDAMLRMIPRDSVLIVVRGMILAHSFPVGITSRAVSINQDMKALLIRDDSARFVARLLQGLKGTMLAHVEESAHGTKCLRTDVWKGITVYLPPSVKEQDAICEYIDQETSKLKALVQRVRSAIERLHEYRTALISAAVTGKIDVRQEVAADG